MLESPYGSFRRGQRESIEFIRSNLGGVIALKAPTGFGKTLVAVLSHLGAGKVFYTVRTRNEMAPVIRELRAVGAEFTIVFSGRRMCPLLRGSEVPPEDFWFNCKVLRFKGMCTYYNNLDILSGDDVVRVLTRFESTDPHKIVEYISNKFKVCPFFTLTKIVQDIDFVVATYPYLFRDDVYSSAFSDLGLDEFYVIVDEAHNLLNPQTVLSESIDLKTVLTAYDEVSRSGYAEIADYLNNLTNLLKSLRSERLKRIDKNLVLPSKDVIDLISNALLEIKLKAMTRYGDRPLEQLMKLTSPLSRVVKFLSLLDEEHMNVYGISRYDHKELHILPVDYELMLKRLRTAKGVLLMSGTLPPKELLEVVVKGNVSYLDVNNAYGPVFPRESVYYVVYTALTTSYLSRSERMFMEYANLLKEVYARTDKAVLAVYPSYEVLEEVVTYLSSGVDNMVSEGMQTKVDDVRKLILGKVHVLVNAVAGGKIVEGVEFRSEEGRSLINVVVVCGVPYPQPDDYLRDFQRSLATYLGDATAKKVSLDMQAGIKVMQAVGRAVRSEQDRAFVVLADRRYLSRSLREVMNVRYNEVTSSLNRVIQLLSSFNPNKEGLS